LILSKENIYLIFSFDIILEFDFVFITDQNIFIIIKFISIIYDFEIIMREYFGLIYLLRSQFFYYKIFKGFIIGTDSNLLINYLKLRILFIWGSNYN
jgi:hypothetical protein